MADTTYGVNANEAVKLWSRKLAREALKKTYARNFMSPSSDSMIQIRNETNKGPGDRIRVTLRMQLSGNGTQGDDTLEGNEEALTTFTFDLIINQLRHAVRSAGKMTEQRIPFSIREETMMGLSDWWADRWDTWLFNQLCGAVYVTDTRFTGQNPVLAPTAGRQVWPNANVADETMVTGTDVFSLALIDKAVERAKTGVGGLLPIRPITVDGGEKWFVVFLHPYQVTDLRTTATAGQVTWYDVQKAQMTGGVVKQNPIFTGALGSYNGCILHESYRVPNGFNSGTFVALPNTRHAVLCGAQAAVCGFGMGHDKSTYDWFEQLFDYGNKLGVKAGCISGLAKAQWNSIDFATVVMSSFAAQH